jgi:hypothetical protein
MSHREPMATELFKRAFAEAAEKLPEFEQDALAEWLLATIAADAQWDELLSKSEDKLGRLADRALEAYQRGDVELFDHQKL